MVYGKPNKSLQTGAAWGGVQWYAEQIGVGVRVHVSQGYTKGEPRRNPTPQNYSDPNGVDVLRPHHLVLLLPRERDCRAVSVEGRASLRGCSGKWGSAGYVKISHHGSTGQINYANISCSPGEHWHFPSCLHRHKCSFPSRLFFSLPPFICRNISDSSDLCPNNQILLIYF